MDAQVKEHSLIIPAEETELKQLLMELQARLSSTTASLTNIFQKACYGITSNPFSLVANVQRTLQQHDVFLGSAFLFEQLVRGLGCVKDGLIGSTHDQMSARQDTVVASPTELQILLKVFNALGDVVDKHNHKQETSTLVSMCITDAVLDNLMDVVRTQLVPLFVQRRGGLRPHLFAIESLTSLFCSHFLKGVLQTMREDFNRYTLLISASTECMLAWHGHTESIVCLQPGCISEPTVQAHAVEFVPAPCPTFSIAYVLA